MELAKGKLADIAQHCIYEIATGKWPPGMKLPSVREAGKLWGVNRLTVLGAYRELEKIGLVVSKDRSGYYVVENDATDSPGPGLTDLYTKVKNLIGKHTDYNLAYAFRFFSAMAVSESKASPTYAFLECTDQQAEDHANEIYQMLNVYVKPVCLRNDPELAPDIPGSVKTLMTTGFHIKEVMEIGKSLNLEVVNVPIEVDPATFNKAVDKAVVVELESKMSSNIVHDIQNIAGEISIEQKLVKDIESGIAELLNDNANQLILLSPRVWGRASAAIKKDKRIKLIKFRISDDSWKTVSGTLKIPLHSGSSDF